MGCCQIYRIFPQTHFEILVAARNKSFVIGEIFIIQNTKCVLSMTDILLVTSVVISTKLENLESYLRQDIPIINGTIVLGLNGLVQREIAHILSTSRILKVLDNCLGKFGNISLRHLAAYNNFTTHKHNQIRKLITKSETFKRIFAEQKRVLVR